MLQSIIVVTATNGASVCVRVCVCVRAILNTSWTIPTYTAFEFQKHPRSTAAVQQQQQQQQRNITKELHICLLYTSDAADE